MTETFTIPGVLPAPAAVNHDAPDAVATKLSTAPVLLTDKVWGAGIVPPWIKEKARPLGLTVKAEGDIRETVNATGTVCGLLEAFVEATATDPV